MANFLGELQRLLDEEIDGLGEHGGDELLAMLDLRYGEVRLEIEHDEDVGSVRVGVALPTPPGAGTEFLVFCLHCNSQYWDLKVGLDDDGELRVMSDIDVPAGSGAADIVAARVIDRVEAVTGFLDEDLTQWLLDHGLGTPAQRARWIGELDD